MVPVVPEVELVPEVEDVPEVEVVVPAVPLNLGDGVLKGFITLNVHCGTLNVPCGSSFTP